MSVDDEDEDEDERLISGSADRDAVSIAMAGLDHDLVRAPRCKTVSVRLRHFFNQVCHYVMNAI